MPQAPPTPTPGGRAPGRVLVASSALSWGLQVALLSPALALLLVRVFGATAGEVGWVLAAYNASGFVASLVIPVRADRRGDYVRPMLLCGLLMLALAGVLAVTTSLGIVLVALVVLGGPGTVGTTLLFAHVRHSGASPSDVVNTRAVFSVAWVAGPPVAALLVGAFGDRAIPAAVGVVALLSIATTAAMIRARGATAGGGDQAPVDLDRAPTSRAAVGLVMGAFVLLQATNATAVAVLALYVTESVGLAVIWAGVALGVAAALEVPALLVMARLGRRYSSLGLIASGCLAGTAYYGGVALVTGPALLLALQVLNAWFIAAVAGTGLTLFQEIIPRPGLASGLYLNTFRVGSILTGPIIVLGASTAAGYRGVFAGCAVLTLVAVGVLTAARRLPPAR